MAGNEARTFFEGALRWAQGSGTGGGPGGWATASAAQTALIGFVQVGVNLTSARNVIVIKDRGIPNHQKIIGREAIDFEVEYLQVVSANMANPATASGASVPAVHFELRYDVAELPDPTAQYINLTHAVMIDRRFTDAEEGNTFRETWRAMFMTGPTASGYIA